jgi:hypothetical protein
MASYFEAGGKKGKGVLATVKGRLVMSDRWIPHSKETRHLVFSVRQVRYEKKPSAKQ